MPKFETEMLITNMCEYSRTRYFKGGMDFLKEKRRKNGSKLVYRAAIKGDKCLKNGQLWVDLEQGGMQNLEFRMENGDGGVAVLGGAVEVGAGSRRSIGNKDGL